AVARGRVSFNEGVYAQIRAGGVAKGDIKAVAELAGVMAAKKTADLIPLCHPLSLTSVRVEAAFNDADCAIDVTASVRVKGPTGVEMEALTAVSVACLTIYDMAKALDKSMTIGGVELVEKSGGASGDFRR
ncbi:MAG: cyclic pyranopterin monophosphate synthase MoaC, partial [Amphiplicatus sp.]